MTVTRKKILPALHQSDKVSKPDLQKIGDQNYTDTILRYGNLAIKHPQLKTNAKTIVDAINELYYRPSGGTTVIPNPPLYTVSGISTESGSLILTEDGLYLTTESGGVTPVSTKGDLVAVEIQGQGDKDGIYTIITANPTESATESLTKIKFNDTVFDIEGGGSTSVEYYPGRGIFFSDEITEEFYTVAPQESGSGAGLSYTTCQLKYKADTTYGYPVTSCHPIRGSLFGGEYDPITNSVLVTCRDYVPEGTLIQIKYTANIADANSINAEVGRKSPAYTYIQFTTDYVSPKNSWKSTGTYIDGNLVQVSQDITDPSYKCFSWGQLEITGIQDITLYIKQDSINTSTAYILISKPGKTFRVETTDTFNGDGVTNVFTLSHEVYSPAMSPWVTFEPSGSYPNTVSGNTITFTGSIPPAGTKISVRYYYIDTDSNKVFKSYKGITTSDYDSCYIDLGGGTSNYYQRVVDVLYVKDGDATISDSIAYFYYEAGTAYLGANGEIFNDYDNNYAIGYQSHAEGGSSLATGNRSHAEGMSKAIGAFSHSEGDRACASGDSSHAEGNSTIASGSYSHAEGNSTVASGRISHAEGNSTQASGSYSHAEGGSTYAEGTYSHSEGIWTYATGDQSHAEGDSTQALDSSAHSEGMSTIAEGAYSHAEGSSTKASGTSSHAEGDTTTASGDYSHVEGDDSVASGKTSHAEGANTSASGDYSHAEGQYSVASNAAAHAEGYSSKALGYASHSEGGNSIASGMYAHAEGNNTQSNGLYSHVEGHNSQASGIAAHAEGDSRVYADYAHSEGYGTIATSPGAHAEGYNSHSHAPYTHSQNLGSWAVNMANTAIGKYNKYTDSKGDGLDLAMMVGNGVDDEHRSNAYTLDWDGNATFAGDITTGTTLATSSQSLAAAINELYGIIPDVSVTQVLPSSGNTKVATITVDSTATDIYAPTPTSVSIDDTLSVGTKVATITIDGTDTEILVPSAGSSVQVTQIQDTGTHIADIEVDGVTTELYAPNAGGAIIDDADIALDKTWSSYKINEMFFELAQRVAAIERYLWGQPVLTEEGDNRVTEDGIQRILEENEE